MPKCSKIRLAAGLCPDPLGSLCAPPDLLAAIRSTFKGRKGGKKKGSTYKGS